MDNTETHTTWNTRHRAKINKTVYTKQKIMNNTGACECNIGNAAICSFLKDKNKESYGVRYYC
jgi:hypothetical protein